MKKTIVSTLYYIFFVAALVLVIYRLYLRNNNRNEEAVTIQWLAIGMLIAALICRLVQRFFPKWFDSKPTREELEQKVHGE
jgi:hypothetical protein